MNSSFLLEEIFSKTEMHVRVCDGTIRVNEVFCYVDCFKIENGNSVFLSRINAKCIIESIWAYGVYHQELHSGMTAKLKVNPEFVVVAGELLNSNNKFRCSFCVVASPSLTTEETDSGEAPEV